MAVRNIVLDPRDEALFSADWRFPLGRATVQDPNSTLTSVAERAGRVVATVAAGAAQTVMEGAQVVYELRDARNEPVTASKFIPYLRAALRLVSITDGSGLGVAVGFFDNVDPASGLGGGGGVVLESTPTRGTYAYRWDQVLLADGVDIDPVSTTIDRVQVFANVLQGANNGEPQRVFRHATYAYGADGVDNGLLANNTNTTVGYTDGNRVYAVVSIWRYEPTAAPVDIDVQALWHALAPPGPMESLPLSPSPA